MPCVLENCPYVFLLLLLLFNKIKALYQGIVFALPSLCMQKKTFRAAGHGKNLWIFKLKTGKGFYLIFKETNMKYSLKVCSYFITACIFLLTSCATTELTLVWKDPNFQGTVHKIAVVGAFKRPSARNFFEDEFVKQLRAHDIEAVASYTFVPIADLKNQNEVMEKIRETGADAALVTRLVDKKTVERYVPGEAYVFPSYYYYWDPYMNYIYTPGYTVEEEYAYAETNIYETSDKKLIWSARSRTLLSGKDQDLIKSFVGIMVNKLSADKLIK